MGKVTMRTLTTETRSRRSAESGQAIVLIAISLVAIAAFVGLAVDTGILIVHQAFLRRGLDSAALAASSQIREGQGLLAIGRNARQFAQMNNLDAMTLVVQMCNTARTGVNEYRAATDTITNDIPLEDPNDPLCALPRRKQVRVLADQRVQFTFLTLIGLSETTLTANSISEAASIDMVLVIDTSMSMGNDNPNFNDPEQAGTLAAACNAQRNTNVEDPTGKCRPLWDTKQAAKDLLETLYTPYDRVSIVTFDFYPEVEFNLSGDIGARDPSSPDYAAGAFQAIDDIKLHIDDKPPGYNPLAGEYYNPVNNRCSIYDTSTCNQIVMTDTYSELSTCTGCGLRVGGSILKFAGRPEAVWIMVFLSDGSVNMTDLPGGPLQNEFGFSVPNAFPSGFCQGPLGHGGWRLPFCVAGNFVDPDTGTTIPYINDPHIRHCGAWDQFDDAGKCPPDSIYVGSSGAANIGGTMHYYDAQDYARDQTDQIALTNNCPPDFKGEYLPGRSIIENCTGQGTDLYNENERLYGSSMAVYSIALGRLAANPPNYAGEVLLRYVAAVGDDGDRATDPCTDSGYIDGTPLTSRMSCGNYYYAPSGGALHAVFEDIAKRIFTRLTR
ncbi:MAG: pilus assembly protein TadG-related protein [Anaerolineales bacterium]